MNLYKNVRDHNFERNLCDTDSNIVCNCKQHFEKEFRKEQNKLIEQEEYWGSIDESVIVNLCMSEKEELGPHLSKALIQGFCMTWCTFQTIFMYLVLLQQAMDDFLAFLHS